MTLIKYLIPLLFITSIATSDHRRKRHHRHKRHNSHRLAVHWHWNHGWYHWRPNNTVWVVSNPKIEKGDQESDMEVMEKIEKLAELKEKGYITEKEFEKKKKDLLKRI